MAFLSHAFVAKAQRKKEKGCILGWDGKKRTNNIQVNIRIKNDKIWIEEDWTEEGIANELMKLGISNLDIVLAFHPPEERKYTEFATA